MTKDKNGNITSTTGEGMTRCAECGIPYPTGQVAAHKGKSTHRAQVAYKQAAKDEDGSSAATGGTTADGE